MTLRSGLTRRLGIAHPIIQAPMAGGGITTPELVAAVSNAGALGFAAAAYLTPAQVAEMGRAVRALTSRPFGVNVFAPVPATQPPADPRPALERLAPFHRELGLSPPALPDAPADVFDRHFSAALELASSRAWPNYRATSEFRPIRDASAARRR